MLAMPSAGLRQGAQRKGPSTCAPCTQRMNWSTSLRRQVSPPRHLDRAPSWTVAKDAWWGSEVGGHKTVRTRGGMRCTLSSRRGVCECVSVCPHLSLWGRSGSWSGANVTREVVSVDTPKTAALWTRRGSVHYAPRPLGGLHTHALLNTPFTPAVVRPKINNPSFNS